MKISFNYLIILFLFLGSAGFATNKTDLKKVDESLFVNNMGYHLKASPFADCPTSVTNNTITADLTTICGEGSVSFSGFVPTITPSTDSTFQWQSKTTGDWTNISGATGINYTTGSLTDTTSFRRLVEISGCITLYASDPITINVNSIPNAPSIDVSNNCGESVLTASDYTGTLLWSTGDDTESITVTTAGPYTVTQTINGCTSAESAPATTAPKPIPLDPDFSVTDNCDGTSTLTTTDYETGAALEWSTTETTNTITVNTAGDYSLKQIVGGCESGLTTKAAAPKTAPTLSATGNTPANCGEQGSIDFTFTNVPEGSQTVSYNGGTLNITVSASGTASIPADAGTYENLTITVNGCTSTENVDVTISDPTPPSAPGIHVSDECGQSVLTATGYDIGATLEWSTNETGESITVTTAGPYTVTQTINGCTSAESAPATAAPKPIPLDPDFSVTDNCDGTSTLTATDYETGAALEWSTTETTNTITLNTAGDYSLKQIVGGCESGLTTKAAAPKTAPTLSATGNTPANCGEQGSIDFTFTNVPEGSQRVSYNGGTLNITVSASGTASIPADAGTYENLTITVNECTSTENVDVTISDPTPPSAPGIDVSDECGQSVLTATGYDIGATLEWSTNETGESITVTTAGPYTVTQTINGCTSAESAPATAAPKPIPAIVSVTEIDPPICQGQGSLNFTFTGVPYGTYDIAYDGNSFKNVLVSGNLATIYAYAASYNNLKITVNGCTSASGVNASLSDPNPPPTPTITIQNNCGESVLTASGYDGTLTWSTGVHTESIIVDAKGDYSVTQTFNGCTSDAATVTATPKTIPAIVNVTENAPTVCLGQGSLDFTFTGVSNGTHNITYDGGSFNDVTVSGNAATVSAPAGTYNNLRIIVNGCSSANGVNASLPDPTPPSAPTITVENNCGESVLTASNYTGTLLWSTGEDTPSITVNTAGAYSLTQSVNGCTSDAATVTAAPKTIPAIVNVTENDPTVCQGLGSLDFTFNDVPNDTYTIAYDGNSFSGVAVAGNAATVQASAGTYNNLRITVDGCTSANGISASLSDPNPPPTPTISVQNNCGESVLTASNYTGTLTWSTGESTKSITVRPAGDYSLTQTLSGCTSDAATATATPKTIPAIVDVKENAPVSCQGQGSLDFTFTGVSNGTYNITYQGGSFNDVTVSGNKATVSTPAGTYNNLTINVNGCTSVGGVSASLSDPTPPSAPTITVENNCGESVLTASNYTGTLLWSTGEDTPSITVNTAGAYSLTQTVNGCISDAATATAAPKTIPVISNVTENDPTACQGTGSLDFTFTGVPNGTYSIAYDGSSFNNITVSGNKATVPASAGTYNNLKINVNGCPSANGVNASLSDPNPPPTPSISVQNNCGESVLTASNYTGTLTWSTGESTPSITVNSAGNYSLTQTVGGCTSDAATATVAPTTIPVITNVTEIDPTICQGQGSLNFTFSGVPDGTYDIAYDVNNSFSNVSVTSNAATVSAPAGIYSNLIITVNGCASVGGVNASLSDPTPPSAPTITVENNCGESVLTVSNYTGILTWNTGESTPKIIVNDDGEYSVTQTVNGCISDAATKTAVPKTIPAITSVSENDPTVCQGQGSLNFTFSGVPNGTYTIAYDGSNFTNVTVSGNAATILATARRYNNLKIIVDGCSSEDGVNASLSDPNPPPAPTISVENYCGESVLTASNYTGSLTWDTGETTESITVYNAREYTLTQTVNGCTSDAATAIAAPERSSLMPNVDVTDNCGESQITVNNLIDNAWLFWQFNNETDSIQGESFTVYEEGEYTIYQKLGNCASLDAIVSANPLTVPSPPMGNDNEICATESIQILTAEATPQNPDTDVLWFDDATGGNEILSPVLDTVGSVTYYAESLNNTTGCISDSRTPVTLTIKPNPRTTFIDTTIIGKPRANVAVLIFPNDSQKYQWYLNNNEITNATKQYYYIIESERVMENVFTVEVELQNGCKAKFNYPYSGNSIGNEFNAFKSSVFNDDINSFKIYPNPVNNNLNIAVDSNELYKNQKLNAKIYSGTGACVLETPLDQNPKSVDIRHLLPGFYSVAIYSAGNRLVSKKLVVTKH